MSLLFEAVRAAFQACSYPLHIPALAVVVLWGVRPRLPAWAVFYASAAVFAWIPFAGVNPVVDGRWAGAAALAGGLFLVDRRGAAAHETRAAGRRPAHPVGGPPPVSAPAPGRPAGRGGWGVREAGGLAGAALAGAFAGAVWLPCVGPELGLVLTSAVSDPGPGLGGLALYLLGVMWPTAALAAAADHLPPLRRVMEGRAARAAFRAAGALIAAAVAFGLYPAVLSDLAKWSSR